MADFLIAVNKALTHEGGLSDDPSDPGGLTNFGISAKYHPFEDIKNLTREQAIEIYRTQYWNNFYDGIINQRLANALLDSAISQGPAVATRLLQAALNEIQAGPLVLDGKLGYQTIGQANAVRDQDELLRRFTALRIQSYAQDSDWKNAHRSWISRSLDY